MSKESHAVHAEKEDSCYHCGEACREDAAIAFDGHVFCCTGCQSVYDILQQADLCDFYALDERTGKVRNQEQHSYRVLDDLDTARQFVEFEHDGIARVTFFSPAIHCSSCIWLLEHLGRVHKGVIQSQVNFLRKEVTVTYHTDQLSLKEVALLLDQVGYAPRIESRKNTGKKRNDLVVRLAVAGFCFGNSMLISIPDYLDMKVEIPDEFQRWFGYINLLFALPVFFYSSSVYFQSAWKGLKHRFVTIDVPVSLGIIALFVRSVVEITVFGELGYVDSLAGLVFFLLIGRWYQHKTYQALSFDRDLASYFPIAVSKIVESNEVTTKLAELVEGDLIRIRNQELIPADGVLEKGIANIDYSFVTGESVPSFHEKGSLMYAGGRQLGGPIEMKLTKKVNNSHLTRLWNQDNEEKEDNKLHNLSDRISQSFTLIILFLAFGAAAYWFFADPSLVVNVFTSILIVACPCALALAVPFTYGHTLRMFGHRGFYLKNANVIEKIAGIQRIVFDKTGTLTSPLPEQVSFVGHELNDQVVQWVYTAASNSIHPLSKILSNRYQDASLTTIERFEEIAGKGLEAVMEGHTIRLGSASWVLAGDVEADNRTKVYLGLDGTYLGYFLFSNVYRPGIFEMLENLTTSHRLDLLSGDNDAEKARLATYFDELRFRQQPEDKLLYIESKQNQGEMTMMVGDGLNDAGALKKSAVGVSISDDVYQFSPSSDAILDGRNIRDFHRYLRFAKTAVSIVWMAFGISFLYNIVGLSYAFTGQLTPLVSSLLMPISSVTVVGFITVMVNFRAKSFFSSAHGV